MIRQVHEFRRPLGLALAGGGALGAWQAGALDALTEGGLKFDKVLGFSAGSLTGSAYVFDMQSELMSRWKRADELRIIRFQPRLSPFSFFSGQPVWDGVAPVADDDAMKRRARCELSVMTHRVSDGTTVYSRFSPRGENGWDGPVQAKLVASCAIPWVFPAVTIAEKEERVTYIDGGIPGKEWMRFDSLKDCRDIIVLEMVRSDELDRKNWTPLGYYDQLGRLTCHRQIDCGIESTASWADRPRVYRLPPSRRLGFSMLDFKSKCCSEAAAQGLEDGRRFLAEPSKELVRVSPASSAVPLGLPQAEPDAA